jgi:hypothetical protein
VKEIKLAPGLCFPAAEFATEVVASLGNRGGGKSNGAAVVAEGLLDAGVQTIVLDYVGLWFSLRLEPDGKTPSRFQIPVLGGPHGDIGLSPTAGAMVAEALAERHSSAVLDISNFSKQERMRFGTDFPEAFFRAKKKHPGPVQILLEESQRFCPQRVQPEQARMLGAWEEIGEVGRNYGIGLHLISQRPQKINKDILNLADTVMGYRTMGVLERKAIGEWVQEKGADGRKEVQDELPTLERGQAIVWCPSRRIFGRFAIRKKSTYDAGATPLAARADVVTKPLDLGALETAMGKAAEDAKANDPTRLRAEIAKLRGELQKGSRITERPKEKRVEVPVVPPAFRNATLEAHRALKTVDAKVDRLRALTQECMPLLADALNKLEACRAGVPAARPTSAGIPPITKKAVPVERPDGGWHTGVGERRVLAAIAQHDGTGGLRRDQLTVLTGYKRSTRDAYLQRLRVVGLVVENGGSARATPEGFASLGDDFELLPTGDALLEHWRHRLPQGELAVLECVVAAWPEAIDRAAIEETTGFKRSTRDAYLQRLRSRRLIEEIERGRVKASAQLFDGAQ